jgi:cell division protein FtsQ
MVSKRASGAEERPRRTAKRRSAGKGAAVPAPKGVGKGVRAPSRRQARGKVAAGNRRKEPKKHEAPRPPRPSLRQRVRVTRERLRATWERVRRPLTIVGKGLVAVAVALGAVGVGQLVERHLRTSPAFAIKEIVIRGGDRLDRSDILAASGLRMGQNAFEVGPEDAQARLEGHPWIASASVQRRLPGTFTVELHEHRAAALLSIEGVLYLVSEEGSVFTRAGPSGPGDLPVITGVSRERFSDEHFRSHGILEVIALLNDYRSAGLWRREPIGEVHVEPDDGLSLYIGDDAALVRLGRGSHRRKLDKLKRVLDRLDAKKARPAYVYLDHARRPDRVTVKVR